MPFGVLPGDKEGEYLADKYNFSYLSVGRDLLRFQERIPAPATKPLVVANPDYNWTLEQESGEIARECDGKKKVFQPLPGTEIEAREIARLLDVEARTGQSALKSKVTERESPAILHVATHGYFFSARKLEEKPSDREEGKKMKRALRENELARSGLAFAGVNTMLEGGKLPPEAEDGMLTARDVTGLKLQATELVVTSACRTGLGDINRGDGVSGLRRAFVLAGAQTLVMSLWGVPDVATAILMERYYYYLLWEKLGRAEALKKAQSYLRNLTVGDMRDKWLDSECIHQAEKLDCVFANRLRRLSGKADNYRPYRNPKCWGAFICQGNPAPLSQGIVSKLGISQE